MKKEGKRKELPQIVWHITNVCNMQCKFCFASKIAQELNENLIKKYVEQFQRLYIQKIDISGGEPLNCNLLERICNELYEKHIFMTITTRGEGMKRNIDWILKNYFKFVRIIVSLDAPNGKIGKELSNNPNIFDKSIAFINQISRRTKGNFRINTVVTRYLLDSALCEEMIALIRIIGCKEWCLIEPHPANKKATFEQTSVNRIEFEYVVNKVIGESTKDGKCKILIRYVDDYAGYWVLDSQGKLWVHTKDEYDISKGDFLNMDVKQLLVEIQEQDYHVPEEKNDI